LIFGRGDWGVNMEQWYIITAIFIVGCLIGKVVTSLAISIANNKKVSIIAKCDGCNKTIHWLLVLKYIAFDGKCDTCKANIRKEYPLFTLLSGISLSLIYLSYGVGVETLLGVILISLLIQAVVTENISGNIINKIVTISVVMIIVIRVISGLVGKNIGVVVGYYLIPGLITLLILWFLIKLGIIDDGIGQIITSVILVHSSLGGTVVITIMLVILFIEMIVSLSFKVNILRSLLISNVAMYAIYLYTLN